MGTNATPPPDATAGATSSKEPTVYSDMDNNASGQSTGTSAADQNARTNNNANGSNRHGKLPQTGSELPLLGILGMGSLSAGVWRAYFKK
jgi:LPXTG-motif cell wall-anchored protein